MEHRRLFPGRPASGHPATRAQGFLRARIPALLFLPADIRDFRRVAHPLARNPAVHLGEVFEDLAVRKPSELAGDVVNRKIMSVALRHDPAPHLSAPAVANRSHGRSRGREKRRKACAVNSSLTEAPDE